MVAPRAAVFDVSHITAEGLVPIPTGQTTTFEPRKAKKSSQHEGVSRDVRVATRVPMECSRSDRTVALILWAEAVKLVHKTDTARTEMTVDSCPGSARMPITRVHAPCLSGRWRLRARPLFWCSRVGSAGWLRRPNGRRVASDDESGRASGSICDGSHRLRVVLGAAQIR